MEVKVRGTFSYEKKKFTQSNEISESNNYNNNKVENLIFKQQIKYRERVMTQHQMNKNA